ncbi:hypothetical protein MCC10113_2104 [Bifidobacterium longum subsp. longum]|nr:hypothetical protein MCC10113_2104 [Bifidobacterium longum subsp. longum]
MNMKTPIAKARMAALAAGLLFVSQTYACPPGTVPQQGIGWQGCAPAPGTSSSSATTDTSAAWADRWGAIAIDMTPGGVGIGSSSGMNRKRNAEKLALSACKRKGGARCEIEITYYNQCAAIVLGSQAFNSSSAASLEEAKRRGIDKCTQAGDKECTVYFSECSFPERIR